MIEPEWSTCFATRKRRYATEEDAQTALTICTSQRHDGDHQRQERDLQDCTHCKGWHLTQGPHCPANGKVSYPNQTHARSGLNRCNLALMHGDPRRQERRMYRCSYCTQWHLTSQRQHREGKAA